MIDGFAAGGSSMMKRSIAVACLAPLLIVLLGGCGDDEKGACTWGSGISGRCWDDFTSGQCNTMNGTLHLDATCADYGYGKSTFSMIIISEIYCRNTDAGAGLGWVELMNVGLQDVDLRGCTLVYGDSSGETASATLDGIIGSSATFVFGGPDSDENNGQPVFDQIINLDAGLSDTGRVLDLVALLMPGDRLEMSCPMSAVTFGGPHNDGLFAPDCLAGVSHLEKPMPGVSFVRTAWPASTWSSHDTPDPNGVGFVLERTATGAESRSWSAITSVY